MYDSTAGQRLPKFLHSSLSVACLLVASKAKFLISSSNSLPVMLSFYTLLVTVSLYISLHVHIYCADVCAALKTTQGELNILIAGDSNGINKRAGTVSRRKGPLM